MKADFVSRERLKGAIAMVFLFDCLPLTPSRGPWGVDHFSLNENFVPLLRAVMLAFYQQAPLILIPPVPEPQALLWPRHNTTNTFRKHSSSPNILYLIFSIPTAFCIYYPFLPYYYAAILSTSATSLNANPSSTLTCAHLFESSF